jgi:hypothetical protein
VVEKAVMLSKVDKGQRKAMVELAEKLRELHVESYTNANFLCELH